ncbi:hypothetical protein AGABI1DRAFT_108887 [Agaricus bisporus var. burnettii JB137-S8]|uniref:Nephrocystin 3-like N-terminal domain-containing protein n=1 Tax=Agaricus bisporus var. burnettii (strain JB137-S8 / ATCC MYA-4627 / FGSC 10392) TaxID=597362 RepID=K5XNU8_AGABU|nr:uncharacterized protein AGABI1DRAFT_108887 [Agaricus bisporus var. burnettii JB137-S8]EKM76350.1 hypothetical protein AGABI1DRAFT_108887 [Agaricus bisporus var. burnettii JB137-S8]
MPMFDRASNVVVHNGTFMDIGQIVHGQSGVDILREASIPEAAYDSEARHPAPSCFPGTRTQYIEDIIQWATSDDSTFPLHWVMGPAGVGKSAVAQTSSERLKESGQLGAAFFFGGAGGYDRPHTRLFTSVAYQLSTELPDYHEIIDRAVSHDKTLITKNMSTQFNSLIVNPLRELQARGKQVERRAIIIDGLDECDNVDAQCQLIEIIAESSRNHTTPFRWAFFSRPEPHIEAMFSEASVSSICRTVVLQVSRTVDGEIESYLRGGFDNIVRHRNISMPSPWPTDKDIRKVVEASAGLFIYAATVLRFVENSRSLSLEESLETVLNIISERHTISGTPTLFAEIDVLYNLIMQRVPSGVLPSVQLLFADMLLDGYKGVWSAIEEGNCLGFSEVEFRNLCNHVRAVVCYHDIKPLPAFGNSFNATRPFEVADSEIKCLLEEKDRTAGGVVSFYHKSFRDFLCDPSRSGAFCVTTPEMHAKLFNHYHQIHHDYSRSFVIRGTGLELAPGFPSSAASLSWPFADPTSELANSYLKARVFNRIAASLFSLLNTNDLDSTLTKKIVETDHRTAMINRSRLFSGSLVSSYAFGAYRMMRVVGGSIFRYIPPFAFFEFDLEMFRRRIEHRTKLNLIQPYHPTLLSKCKSYFSPHLSRDEHYSGLYKFGHGTKSHFWYWEINLKFEYYFEFETCDLTEARKIHWREKDNLLGFFSDCDLLDFVLHGDRPLMGLEDRDAAAY